MVTSGELVWFHDLDCGYVCPSEPYNYGRSYFEDYVQRSRLLTSDKLMLIRRNFVDAHYTGPLLDFGCGSVTFVEYMKQYGHQITGYDINPFAVQVLMNTVGLYCNPYVQRQNAITFWDTLEHVKDPERIINRVNEWAFVCMPIYEGMEQARRSKHFKPGEHIWYFTDGGLIDMFQRCGFACMDSNEKENGAGRSGIKSYAFKRKVGPT